MLQFYVPSQKKEYIIKKGIVYLGVRTGDPKKRRGHCTYSCHGRGGLSLNLVCSAIPTVEEHAWSFQNQQDGASLVAQWLRICLPMQGTRVRALVWEDPTCCGATRSVSHNY